MSDMNNKLGEAADERLETLNGLVEKALAGPRRVINMLVATVVVLAIAFGATGYLMVQEDNLAHALQQDSINSCLAGNQYLASQTAIWEDLIKLSNNAKPPAPNSQAQQLQNEFLQFIEKTNAPKNCATQYGK